MDCAPRRFHSPASNAQVPPSDTRVVMRRPSSTAETTAGVPMFAQAHRALFSGGGVLLRGGDSFSMARLNRSRAREQPPPLPPGRRRSEEVPQLLGAPPTHAVEHAAIVAARLAPPTL